MEPDDDGSTIESDATERNPTLSITKETHMYLINIQLNADKIPPERRDALFEQHRTWFAEHFDKGNFLLLGPYLDADLAGIIIAQTENRTTLEAILATDVYHGNGMANYEIREFEAAMVSDELHRFQGK